MAIGDGVSLLEDTVARYLCPSDFNGFALRDGKKLEVRYLP
jgi:hypothetical protein